MARGKSFRPAPNKKRSPEQVERDKPHPSGFTEATLGHFLVPVRAKNPGDKTGRPEAALGAPAPMMSG